MTRSGTPTRVEFGTGEAARRATLVSGSQHRFVFDAGELRLVPTAAGAAPSLGERAVLTDHGGVWELVPLHGSVTIGGSPAQRVLIGHPVELEVDNVRVSFRAGPPPEPVLPLPKPGLGGSLEPSSLVVRGVTVEAGGKRRLDHVDFDLTAGQMMAVLGTSGAGKSTLLKALTGAAPATSGSIVFDAVDLYDNFDRVGRAVGYVPQDDILHPQLTVAETLRFAAQLRFPAETDPAARASRVAEVLAELGLTHRGDARIDELSGGQRKRVSVAVELLTRPSLLILDEPTSGLDPGNERSMMELLRALCDNGRIVIVVTHSVESLHLCDTVLFLADGGVPVHLGPPAELPARFGVASLSQVFRTVESAADLSQLRVPRWPTPPVTSRTSDVTPSPTFTQRWAHIDHDEFGRYFSVLTRRYYRVVVSDRRNLMILTLQAPIIAVVMLVVFGSGFLKPGTASPEAGNVLMGIGLASIYLGASNAVREVVKERAILRRELDFGVPVSAYVASKFAVLGPFTLVQCTVLVVAGTARQGGPAEALLLLQPKLEFVAIVAAAGLCAVAFGLTISSFASTPDRAMTVLPVLLFLQFLLAGLVFPVSAPGIQQLSWLMPSRWAVAGTGATADFWNLRGCGVIEDDCSQLWHHELVNLIVATVLLLALGAAAVYATWRRLRAMDPRAALRRAAHI